MIGAIASTSCHRLIRLNQRVKPAIRQVKLRSLNLNYLKRAWICRHQVLQLCLHPARKHATKTQPSPSDNRPSTVVCSSSLERAQTRPLPGLNHHSSLPPKASSNAVLLFKTGSATLSRCSRPVSQSSPLTPQKTKTPTPKKSLMSWLQRARHRFLNTNKLKLHIYRQKLWATAKDRYQVEIMSLM